MINKQLTAEKIQDYIQHKLSLNELVNWAENTLAENEFENKITRDIIAKLAVADVRAFGLQWEDCEKFLNQPGYEVKVQFLKAS